MERKDNWINKSQKLNEMMCDICAVYFTVDDNNDLYIETHYKYVNCKYYCLRIYYKENRTIITGLGKTVFVGDCIIKVTPSNVAGKIETILVFQ